MKKDGVWYDKNGGLHIDPVLLLLCMGYEPSLSNCEMIESCIREWIAKHRPETRVVVSDDPPAAMN